MSFDWEDFLRLAEALQAKPGQAKVPEASYRSAASRAYYAAYQKALHRALEEGYIRSSRSGDDHVNVQKYFSQSRQDKLHRKIGTELDRLRDLRNHADYDDELVKNPDYLAQFAIGMAKSIISNLKSL